MSAILDYYRLKELQRQGFDLSKYVNPELCISTPKANSTKKPKYCYTCKHSFRTAADYTHHINSEH